MGQAKMVVIGCRKQNKCKTNIPINGILYYRVYSEFEYKEFRLIGLVIFVNGGIVRIT